MIVAGGQPARSGAQEAPQLRKKLAEKSTPVRVWNASACLAHEYRAGRVLDSTGGIAAKPPSINRAIDSFGHVRARRKLTSGEWSVTVFGDARPLAELSAKKPA
jgi:hypothetical protein